MWGDHLVLGRDARKLDELTALVLADAVLSHHRS